MHTGIDESVIAKARRVRLLVLDCDGVLTDGSLLYGNDGEELKAFSILDGLGIKLLRASEAQKASAASASGSGPVSSAFVVQSARSAIASGRASFTKF